MKCALSLMAVLLVAAMVATAQGHDKYAQESLRGLKEVSLLIEGLEPRTAVLGLNKSAIQADVELGLRQAGIKVLTGAESRAVPDAAMLHIKANMREGHGAAAEIFSCSLDVRLIQRVRLERDPGIAHLFASTWSAESGVEATGGGPGNVSVTSRIARGDAVGRVVRQVVDQFINAWLLVNPK
jgi:hypothetical protein